MISRIAAILLIIGFWTQPSTTVAWPDVLRQPASWYAGADAVRIADNVRLYQRSNGGWPKNVDMAAQLTPAEREKAAAAKESRDTTIDNGATVTQLRYLGLVFGATREERFRAAFIDGLDYVLGAEYPGGGWPQDFPLRNDYSRRITFNDEALTGVATLLRDIPDRRQGFELVDGPRRLRASAAIARTIRLMLATQIRVGNTLTGWCQQYDERTLQPAGGRSYEHPSIVSRETVSIVRFLMAIDAPDQDTKAAIEGAVAWLRRVQIHGLRTERRPDPAGPNGFDVVVVDDASAPPIWARFYEIGTNRPIFSGRDGVIKYRLAEIEIERRAGYGWLNPYATALLAKEYPAWIAKTAQPSSPPSRVRPSA